MIISTNLPNSPGNEKETFIDIVRVFLYDNQKVTWDPYRKVLSPRKKCKEWWHIAEYPDSKMYFTKSEKFTASDLYFELYDSTIVWSNNTRSSSIRMYKTTTDLLVIIESDNEAS